MLNASKATDAIYALKHGPKYRNVTDKEFWERHENIFNEFRAFLENEYARGYYKEVLDVIWSQAKETHETRIVFSFYQFESLYQEYEKFTGRIVEATSPY